MEILPVIVKRKWKWYIGESRNLKFKQTDKSVYKSLGELKKKFDLLTFKAYAKKNEIDLNKEKNYLKKLKCESVYFINEVMDGSEKALETWWWGEGVYSKCKKCKKDCKQSSRIINLHCPVREV